MTTPHWIPIETEVLPPAGKTLRVQTDAYECKATFDLSPAGEMRFYTLDHLLGEIAGVMVTLAALCLAQGQDMVQCGETELARIWTKVEAIRAKQAAKPKHSPLPERDARVEDRNAHVPQLQADVEELKTLIRNRHALDAELQESTKDWPAVTVEDAVTLRTAANDILLEEKDKQIAHWKANHDNQVRINRILRDRPDMGDRARRVDELIKLC